MGILYPEGSVHVGCLILFFRECDLDYAPRSDFAGRLTVAGKAIDYAAPFGRLYETLGDAGIFGKYVAELPLGKLHLFFESGVVHDLDAEQFVGLRICRCDCGPEPHSPH